MQTNPSIHRTAFSRHEPGQEQCGSPGTVVFHPPSSILHPLSSTGSPRNAFTLIELLVVTTIIAILTTLTISVVGAFLTQARDAATKTTVNKIQGLLNSREAGVKPAGHAQGICVRVG